MCGEPLIVSEVTTVVSDENAESTVVTQEADNAEVTTETVVLTEAEESVQPEAEAVDEPEITAEAVPVKCDIRSAVKTTAKSSVFLNAVLFFTIAFGATIALSVLNLAEFSSLERLVSAGVIGISAVLAFFGLWITYLSAHGKKSSSAKGLSVIKFSVIVMTAFSACVMISEVFSIVFSVVSGQVGDTLYTDFATSLGLYLVLLIVGFSAAASLGSTVSSLKNDRAEVKYATFSAIMCFVLAVLAVVGCAGAFIAGSVEILDLILIASALACTAVSLIMFGISALKFKSNLKRS